MADEELVVVYETNDIARATIFKSLLEEDGIGVLMRETGDLWTYSFQPGTIAPYYELLVLKDHEVQARQLVEAYRIQVEAGEMELPEDEQPE